MTKDKYYNLGWFGRHPFFYEIGSFFIRPIRKRAAHYLGDKKLNVLDIATGTGAQALEIAKMGHDVVGIDLDDTMLEKAMLKCSPALSLRFMHADGTALPFSDHSFDAVTISFAMHDVPNAIGIKILEESRRVLKTGGEILIVDYNELGRNPGAWLLNMAARFYESPNYAPFVSKPLNRLFELTGLRIIKKSTFLGAVQFVIGQPA